MLIEVLRAGAGAVPDQPLVVSPEQSVTYSASLRRSEALARGLHDRSLERFACVVDNVADLTALLCGSSAVGSGALDPDGKEHTVPTGVRNNAKSIYKIAMLAEGFKGRAK